MKATELRIGNWVEYKGHHVIWDVTDFADNAAKRLSRPIPLSEEWLLKFGFEKDGPEYTQQNIRFTIYNPRFYKHFVFCDRNTVLTEKIRCVHQLQNLYFALTGEELKLTASTA